MVLFVNPSRSIDKSREARLGRAPYLKGEGSNLGLDVRMLNKSREAMLGRATYLKGE